MESLEDVLWRYSYEDGYYLTTQETLSHNENAFDDISDQLEFM
jgi:hypothetical protein